MKRTILIILCLTTLATASVHQFANQQEPEEKNEEIEVFRIGAPSVSRSDEPEFSSAFSKIYGYFSFLIYENLSEIVSIKNNPNAVRILNNNRELLITLPRNIYFHNGKEFNVNDVIYSLDMMERLRSDCKVCGPLLNLTKLSIEKLGNYDFVIRSRTPVNFHMLLDNINIIDSTAPLSNKRGALLKPPSGTGPYIFDSFSGDNRIVFFNRNLKYRHGVPSIKKLEIHVFPDLESIAMALINDKVDFAPLFGSIEKETLTNNREIQLFPYPMQYCQTLFLNVNSPKLSDPRVRRALSLVIDRNDLVNTNKGLEGTRIPSDTFFNFVHPKTKITADPPNGKEAIRLFNEAGYKLINGKLIRNGKQMKLTIALLDNATAPYSLQAARVVRKYWENSGIDCDLILGKSSEFNKSNKINSEVVMIQALENHPKDFFSTVFTDSDNGLISFHFSDNHLNKLIDRMRDETDDRVLLEHKKAIRFYLKEQAPLIPLYYDAGFAALGRRFKDNQTFKKYLRKSDLPFPRHFGIIK